MLPDSEPIAAIATAPGRGGIGIVRVSGANLAGIIQGVIGRTLVARHATACAFRDAVGASLDEGIALHFPGPASYTGEDVLELQGHGGPTVLQLLLERCVELGARLAAPGEFTQRAFLNGKLDLAQAEAVADLIDAATRTAARAALRSLTGEFSARVHALAEDVLQLRMLTEAALDFPEEDIDFVRAADASRRLVHARQGVGALLEQARQGALLREGLVAVLVGAPNVGKSSLLNRLAGEDVAIVTPVAGTTRDALRTSIEVRGVLITIVDTAGLRPTDDPVETLGIERTWASVASAHLVLVVLDEREAAEGLYETEQSIVSRLPEGLPTLMVHNKIDLTGQTAGRAERPSGSGSRVWNVYVSAKTGAGLDALQAAVLEAAGVHEDIEGAFLARARHVEALRQARDQLDAAQAHIDAEAPALELFAEELRQAHDALGTIVGAVSADDLLGVIFSRFCIGK